MATTSELIAGYVDRCSLAVGDRHPRQPCHDYLAAQGFHEQPRRSCCLSGFFCLPAGLAIVLVHNFWVADWPILVTILGWLCVIGGAIRIICAAKRAAAMRRSFSPSRERLTAGRSWRSPSARS